MPLGQTVKMALAWLAIFAAVFVLFLFRDEARAIWNRATNELSGTAPVVVGQSVRIKKSDDGHFHVRASVNGKPIEFLIDSGATTTTLSAAAAANAGVEPSGGFAVMVRTANGMVEAQRAEIALLTIGPITQANAPALIGGGEMGDTNLLGMSFLSSLKSWRVEEGQLVLTL